MIDSYSSFHPFLVIILFLLCESCIANVQWLTIMSPSLSTLAFKSPYTTVLSELMLLSHSFNWFKNSLFSANGFLRGEIHILCIMYHILYMKMYACLVKMLCCYVMLVCVKQANTDIILHWYPYHKMLGPRSPLTCVDHPQWV